MSGWPSVGVIVPTRGDRPESLREAVTAVLEHDYPGELSLVVVADAPLPSHGQAPAPSMAADAPLSLDGRVRPASVVGDASLSSDGQHPAPVVGDASLSSDGRVCAAFVADQVAGRLRGESRVRVLGNTLSPGLPGARNTGIAACDTDLVAFCDDDDVWLPGKLAAQVRALRAGGGEFASCGIEVEHGRCRVPRLAGASLVTADDLVRSRMVMVHSSTFLFERGALWVDESAPGGQNEDWDLALRAAKRAPIVHVDRPLVRVRWAGSHYAARWADRIAGLEWMLARHPELAVDPRGAARVYGQLAFAHAALGRRREAARWAGRTFAARLGEPRAPIALAVAAGLVSAPTVLSALHSRGHGI
ncbi:Glycosyl transferase family 2 [Nonomuraea maritima]|uniref:Glycosyl transferase family 2 n=1 Tax=Nonomuraea maritima TaxID=683260 RepID=A0A1G8UE93_9ACTN|nr:glycosyltransferase [Nonomuraea maritima]SDJ52052.1 Glycosyl transferase family 2 [Nonomuraea maritima]